jgi:acyl dehydratase
LAEVGATARRTRRVTERDIELFTELTGDRNPLHYDEDAARRSRFGGLIVQGGVTSGLLNAVVAEDLPGPGSVFLRVDWSFKAPVRPGDEIMAEVELLEVREDKPLSTLRTTITNQDDLDREGFLSTAAAVVELHLWKCHAFCLMTKHFHLLVETPDESLPNGMQRLNLGHARSFNRRYGTTGHVFEAPYHSEPVTRESHALLAIRYIVRNPVEAGLYQTPEEWPWSSHGASLGLRRAPPFLTSAWVLGLFGDDVPTARQRLRQFALTGPGPVKGP